MDRPRKLAKRIEADAVPLDDSALEELSASLADRRIVMLGEASHGTHEYYTLRTRLSQILIEKHGFSFIGVEGDWPACYAVNRSIRPETANAGNQADPLAAFVRWPTWMWSNQEVLELVGWLTEFNRTANESRRASFYGLDVYSLFESVTAVLNRLDEINPLLARRARARYACFRPFGRDERAYARSLFSRPEGCRTEVLEVIENLERSRLANRNPEHEEALFDAHQNARIIGNAERYYRSMVEADDDSWNVRDRHMMDTLDDLLSHHGPASKAIVWAHNTHIGDYRATDMLSAGLVNLGGLARERHGERAVALVGFGSHAGTVIASHAWDGPTTIMDLPEARFGTAEHAMHEAAVGRGIGGFYLDLTLRKKRTVAPEYEEPVGHRAVGVVYDPRHEGRGNYVPTILSSRYDAFVFIDRTTALSPLIRPFERGDIPETWPTGT